MTSLVKSSKSKDRELANSIFRTISHDFKEPLRSIRWYSDKMLTDSNVFERAGTERQVRAFEKLVTGIQNDFQRFYSEYKERKIRLPEFRKFVSTRLGRRIRNLNTKWRSLYPAIEDLTFTDPQLADDPEISIQNFNDTVKRLIRRYDGLVRYLRMEDRANPIQLGLHNEINRVLKDLVLLRSERNFFYEVQGFLTGKFDQSLVASIFQNLIINSIKYRDVDRPLRVQILLGRCIAKQLRDLIPASVYATVLGWRANEVGVVIYEDNAIGIKPGYETAVFEPFVQVDPNAHDSGSGMGLAIVRSAVERNGGVIWLKTRYGCGTSFYMLFPGESSLFRGHSDSSIINWFGRIE